MTASGSYVVPAASREAEIRDKGSKFLAVIAPATNEETARARLAEIERRFPDATHHCFAWRLGDPAAERASDAGEPAGTAGQPILRALRGAGLSDAVAVVVRWFGGTKLGKGALARAYSGATRAALEGLPVARRLRRTRIELEIPYDAVGAVKRALRPPAIELLAERYGERAVLTLAVADSELDRLAQELAPLGIVVDDRP